MKTKIRALLIDDELHCIETLKFEIQRHCPEVEIITTASNGHEGIAAIEAHQPDLVFLDIEMPEMNGFEMLQNLKEYNFHLIFVTAYDHYAIKAFKYSAIDYLMKPVNGEDLSAAIQRINVDQNILNRAEQIAFLRAQLSGEAKDKKVALPLGNVIEFVEISKIKRLEASGNYSIAFLSDERKLTLTKTLKDIESILQSDNFLRIHKSHLINKTFISRYIKIEGGYIEFATGEEFKVTLFSKDEMIKLI